MKAYNVLTLLEFVAKHLETHYQKKFRDFANSRVASPRLFLLSLKGKISLIPKDAIEMIDENLYLIKGEKETYVVNSKSGCCSCTVGMYGRYCKHQYSVFEHFNIVSKNFPPVKPQDKYEISVLALGDKAPPREFYDPLIESSSYNEISHDVVATSSEISSAPSASNTEYPESKECEERKKELLQEILNQFAENNDRYKSSFSGLNKFLTRLKKVKSSGSWETFLHSAGNNVPLRFRSGSAIRVQPTSISRRPSNLTRGSKRLPAGRSAAAPPSKKRKHCLSLNIKLNQPNAKRH